MKEARYFYVPDAAMQSELPGDEALHALRVLRLREGDEIFLMDGRGCFFRAEVTLTNNKHCMYVIREVLPQERAWRGKIHLAIAPTKMTDRIEWMAEKAVEVGVDEITFLDCQYSERHVIRTDRIEKIVVSAMKQSRKPWLTRVNPMISFQEFVRSNIEGMKYIAHCYSEIQRNDFFNIIIKPIENENVTVLVGPEGDFSFSEVQVALDKGYESVSLGTSRLRTETAGLAAIMMAQLKLRY
ncbi:MAG: 16S rRNA (uracil(1498)-N(3))-methyltransferase [Prevotella sp.]|nr:16S rRNA (uracil(1498)-N(3))-methyltransferase [Prevotella sp.]